MLSIVVPEFMDSVPVTVDIKIIEVNLWFLAIKALLNETSLHQFDNLVTDGFRAKLLQEFPHQNALPQLKNLDLP
ncbi:MAG: hypothetical protein ACPG6U_01415 [Paracoccaceae bacterium]